MQSPRSWPCDAVHSKSPNWQDGPYPNHSKHQSPTSSKIGGRVRSKTSVVTKVSGSPAPAFSTPKCRTTQNFSQQKTLHRIIVKRHCIAFCGETLPFPFCSVFVCPFPEPFRRLALLTVRRGIAGSEMFTAFLWVPGGVRFRSQTPPLHVGTLPPLPRCPRPVPGFSTSPSFCIPYRRALLDFYPV